MTRGPGGARPALRRRAQAVLAAAGTACALLVSGCSGSGADSAGSGRITLTFTWWGNDDRAKRTNEVVALFEKRHPGITVRTSFASYDTYVPKLATQAAGGDLPDVAQLDYRQISQYAGSGTLLDLGPYLGDGTIRTADFDKDLTRTGVYGGTQVAVPMSVGTTGFAYDAAVFHKAGVPDPKPGWTWQDWAAAGRKISALGLKGPDGRAYTGLGDVGGTEDAFEEWLRGQGKRLYASQHQVGFTVADLTRFWTWTDKLRREGVVSQAKDTAQIGSVAEDSPLGRGLAATDFNWDAPFLSYPPMLGDSIHFAPVPSTRGRLGQYFKPSMLIGIGSGSAHPKEAAELIDFILNEPDAGRILGVSRSTPANRRIAESLGRTLKGPEKEVYDYGKKIAAYGTDPPPAAPPRGDVVLQVSFSRAYQQVIFRRQSPAEAAAEFVAEAGRELR